MVDDLSFAHGCSSIGLMCILQTERFAPIDWSVIGLTTHKKKIYSQEGFIMPMYWNAEAISKA